jgi:hypothetical protein
MCSDFDRSRCHANNLYLRRHLIRLWLRDPEHAWPTPSVLSERWSQLYDGVTPENQVFPLEPRIRSSGRGSTKEEKVFQ